jgi:hypothetical protein
MKDHLGSALLFLVALPATTLGQSTALSALDAFPDCAVSPAEFMFISRVSISWGEDDSIRNSHADRK